MIKVSVLYPNREGSRFDMDYYCTTHIGLCKDRLGDACKGVDVEAGLSSAAPGSAPPYVAMGHLYFDSLEAYSAAFGLHAEEILGDIPNYTDVEPVIQISEVKL